jgi:hypothetical protein
MLTRIVTISRSRRFVPCDVFFNEEVVLQRPFSRTSGFYFDVPPLDTELEGRVDLVLPHRDIDAMRKPPVHAVEDDAFAVSFNVQDRLRIDEVCGANLEPPCDEAAEVFPCGPKARMMACLPPHPHVVGGHFPD